MNTTIEKIVETTKSDKVLNIGAKMIAWANKPVRLEFVKKDGSLRKMLAIFRDNWNTMNGISTTESGRKMVGTKVRGGMATVTEIIGNGMFQPRTVNLNTIVKMELA